MTALPAPAAATELSEGDRADLADLYARGTPANTLRAYERDLVYIAAWRRAAFGGEPAWPESEEIALRFVLDHGRDLRGDDGPARQVAERLVAAGLRRSLACPAPATLDRRIASWRAFHRMRNLASPFDSPLLRQARAKARRANAQPPAPKSPNPITRDVLEAMLAVCGPGLRGLRDRAVLMLGWASGGRRRSEIAGLDRADVSLATFDADGRIWIDLVESKTTRRDAPRRLLLKGRAARAVVAWLDAAGIDEGPLFRAVSKADRPLARRLAPDTVTRIVRRRLVAAGYEAAYASAHGLRSGFLTQAARDGTPLPAAMRLSLHSSASQAQRYYADADLAENAATDLLG